MKISKIINRFIKILKIILKTILQILILMIPVIFGIIKSFYTIWDLNIIDELGFYLIIGAIFILCFHFAKTLGKWFDSKFIK